MSTAFVILCMTQMVQLSRHWRRLTARILRDRREARLKAHLNWAAKA